MAAPSALTELVERFRRNQQAYKSPTYNETQVRRELIDPFFKLLGWDIDNEAGYAEAYKDVVHEDSLKIGTTWKAPDYSFRIGGARKFFVEAKKPATNIRTDAAPAYQLRRYAWSAKLPVSILTDFEELAVYDCRKRPDESDRASTARILFLRFDEYADRWDELSGKFSREAVLLGSFDEFATGLRGRRGTAEVDDAFLEEIEGWRQLLAKNFALRNESLSEPDLNAAVQQTIDRIVFLRIAEDRGIEPYGRLQKLLDASDAYGGLTNLFLAADDRYNSGLFHFRRRRGDPRTPDEWTLDLELDDKPLKTIIGGLYYPKSPYEFSVLPPELLGNVYERFLGKRIRLTPGHRAVVEEKPEVRRAGGVYYTPGFVVEYLCEHAINPLLEGSTPAKVSRIRILDPACGSGSFLLAAYQRLLDWHQAYYLESGRFRDRVYDAGGSLALTVAERKRILLNSIFGVDIDPQAVEVTKLSLLLKVLEGETEESISRQLRLFHERALPDLDSNIRSGNSLVDSTVYDTQLMDLLSDSEQRSLNPFDWVSEFPGVFATGGFDIVIGNPPYVYRNATEETLRTYYRERYSVAEGNYELYKFFLERSLQLIRRGGRLGFIVSASFLVQPSFTKLRRLLVTEETFERLSPLGPGVFRGATVDTAVLVLRREAPKPSAKVAVSIPRVAADLPAAPTVQMTQKRFAQNSDYAIDCRVTDEGSALLEGFAARFEDVETYFEFGVGINTGFIRKDLVAPVQRDIRYHPMIPGDGISRYGEAVPTDWIMYDPVYVRSRGRLGRSLPPSRFFDSPKILVVRTRNLSLPQRIIATIDELGGYNLNRLTNIIAREGADLRTLLGVLNSTLYRWLYSTRYFDYEVKPVYLRQSPMPVAANAGLSALVARRMAVEHSLVTGVGHEAIAAGRQAAMIDRQIDERVFSLFEMTDTQIATIRADLDRLWSVASPGGT